MPPLLLALALLATPAPRPDAVAARVGKDVITVGEVVSRAEAGRIKPPAALEELVREALVADLARSEGLDADPRLRERLAKERRRLAVDRFLYQEIDARIRVTAAEVAEAFHAKNDDVRYSMVIRATEPEARDALARLRQGSGIIAEAKQSSDATIRARSGVLPEQSRGEVQPALARAVFEAPLGEPSGPVRVATGFAVFVVHERRIADDAALPREAPAIRTALEKARREQLAKRLVAELRRGEHARRSPGDDRQLLEEVAVRRGFERHRDVVVAMRSVTRNVLGRAYAHRVGDHIPYPGDAEVATRYQKQAEDFWTPGQRACVVLDARTEQDAERLRSRIVAGEPLEEVARAFAISAAKPQRTSRVTFTDPDLDKMSAAGSEDHALAWTVRRAKTGEWTLVDGHQLWHVVRCEDPRPRVRRPLAEVRKEIADAILRQRTTAAIDERVAARRRATSVRTYPDALPRLP